MNNDGRSDLVKVVTSPLGFFALSLLIVEGFLGIVLVMSNLDSADKFYGMIVGAALFFLLVLGVWILVWRKPINLTFGEHSHLEHEKMTGSYGTERKEKTEKEVNKEVTMPDTSHE